jgi:hypothetical protein
LGVLVLFLVGAAGVGLWAWNSWEMWFAPQLTSAAMAADSKAHIVVGKTVHVSTARPNLMHQGCTIAADDSTPARLFAASMVTPPNRLPGVVGYFSHDGGASWQLGHERIGRKPEEGCCDEAVTFSAEGDLILAYMRVIDQLPPGREAESATVFLVSADGGKTWAERAAIQGIVDRPQITTDSGAGPYRGRLYCNANILVDRQNLAAVFASTDGAKNMTPASLPSCTPTIYNSNPAVLADGTVLVAYHLLGQDALASPRFPVLRSTDGGRSFAAATPVRTLWRHPRYRSQSGTTLYPRLGADASNTQFAGRLYCVWSDGPFIMFSYTADRGGTWSGPTLLSEQVLQGDKTDDYYSGMPAIAVNKLGQIAVLWYDRRGLPPQQVVPTDTGKRVVMSGYNLRLRASLDGGSTWLPSVQVNETTGRGHPVDARHWVGMASSADGHFHPCWISDCSGTLQMWTANVSLEELPGVQ